MIHRWWVKIPTKQTERERERGTLHMHTHTCAHTYVCTHTHTLQDNDTYGTEVRGGHRVTRSPSPKSREHGVAYNREPSIIEENAEDTKLYILQVSMCMKARTCVHACMQTWIFAHSINHSPLTHTCVCMRTRTQTPERCEYPKKRSHQCQKACRRSCRALWEGFHRICLQV